MKKMKKSTLFVLSFLATVPVLLSPQWWSVPIQVIACGLVVVVHASSGVSKEESIKISMFYSGVCFLGLVCVSSLAWPWALLASIGAHFLGVLSAGLLLGRGDVECEEPPVQEWIPKDDPRYKKKKNFINRFSDSFGRSDNENQHDRRDSDYPWA